jgi:hypothetical protein
LLLLGKLKVIPALPPALLFVTLIGSVLLLSFLIILTGTKDCSSATVSEPENTAGPMFVKVEDPDTVSEPVIRTSCTKGLT